MELAKKSNEQLALSKVSSAQDLVNLPSIRKQVKIHGEAKVQTLVNSCIVKASMLMDVEISESRVVALSEELMELYEHEAVEDIVEALKKGRRGIYGYGMHKRGALSMPLIMDWMSKHLDEKAQAREQRHEQRKWAAVNDFSNVAPDVVEFLSNIEFQKGSTEAPKKVATEHELFGAQLKIASNGHLQKLQANIGQLSEGQQKLVEREQEFRQSQKTDGKKTH